MAKRHLMFCKDFKEFAYNKFENYILKIFVLGSAKRGEWVYGRSDIDIIVVLRRKGVESFICKYYWYLDLKYETNIINIPFYHPPIMFVRNNIDYKLAFIDLIPNKSPRLSMILKKSLHCIVPRIKYLKPWLTKHPVIASNLFLAILLPIRSLARKLES
ncbi:MAG: nucleotidyltransferase domain-containing protein [Candidatus Methanomethylicia archaeon]